MKVAGFSLIALFAAVADAGISRPEVLVGINVGQDQYGTLGGIEPKVMWTQNGVVAGCDVEGGIDLTMIDIDVPPRTNIWGKLKRTIKDIGVVSVRGDVDANAPDNVDLDIRASAYGADVQLLGQAGSKKVTLSKVQVTKDVSAMGGILTLTPKYDLDSAQGDIHLGYAVDGTTFQLDGQSKKLTVAHTFNDRDTIAPTVTLAGDVSLSYSRNLDRGRVTTTYTPNDSVKLQWSDGVYETTIKAPMDGYYNVNQGIKVNMKRSISI